MPDYVDPEPGHDPVVTGAIGGAASHEFQSNDRTGHHRIVATAMLVTFGMLFISQGWWKAVRDWITTKTHGPATSSKPGG